MSWYYDTDVQWYSGRWSGGLTLDFFKNSSWLYVGFSAFWHAKSGLEMFVLLGHSVSLMLHEL